MTDLRTRKQLLALQADLHRALLRAEYASARARLDWLDEARKTARSISPWLAAGAAIVGLLAAWQGRKLGIWIPSVVEVWRRAQKSNYG